MNVGPNRIPAAPGQATDGHRAEALSLIRTQRTMVLATALSGQSWAAPVYYVYSPPGFYFFSSPRARHIEQGLMTESAAASIFADSEQWDKIQGIQMNGTIEHIRQKTTQLKIGARFILKFPFAEPFLKSGEKGADKNEAPKVGDRVNLYVFLPQTVYYVNNRLGFGKRVQIALQ